MLDIERLQELSTELGVDVVESLVGEFFDDFKERTTLIESLCAADSSPTLIREFAHDIKGSAGNIGLMALADAAHQIGLFVKDNQLDSARAALADLPDMAVKSQNAFQEWLAGHPQGE